MEKFQFNPVSLRVLIFNSNFVTKFIIFIIVNNQSNITISENIYVNLNNINSKLEEIRNILEKFQKKSEIPN